MLIHAVFRLEIKGNSMLRRHTMKNAIRLLSFCLIATTLGAATAWQQAAAQTPALSQQMPVDPQITMGKFANGLRYYIRANKKPEKRAELRLVVKAGSVLEDDDQQGLAHFVEHMAFNGTQHFPKQELVH